MFATAFIVVTCPTPSLVASLVTPLSLDVRTLNVMASCMPLDTRVQEHVYRIEAGDRLWRSRWLGDSIGGIAQARNTAATAQRSLFLQVVGGHGASGQAAKSAPTCPIRQLLSIMVDWERKINPPFPRLCQAHASPRSRQTSTTYTSTNS